MLAFLGCFKKTGILIFLLVINTGCQISYLLKNGYHQARLLTQREKIESVLNRSDVTPEIKHKLLLAIEAKKFAESELQLAKTENYSTYVDLKRNYVTLLVTASESKQLKSYQWWFPIVGHVPYKGFFDSDDAKKEAEILQNKGYDTYTRGVSAFSTLGYFKDPILSTMMLYDDHDLVNTIIHELVHSTIFIASSVEFNEQMAMFIGAKGAELFFESKGPNYNQQLNNSKSDYIADQIFGRFVKQEVEKLELWYRDNPNHTQGEKKERLKSIQLEFKNNWLSQMPNGQYASFADGELNNARMIALKTYVNDLSAFEKFYKINGENLIKTILAFKNFEKEKDPALKLQDLVKEVR